MLRRRIVHCLVVFTRQDHAFNLGSIQGSRNSTNAHAADAQDVRFKGLPVSISPQPAARQHSQDRLTPYNEGMPTGLILGIESSCDETAASVVRAGSDVLSNVIASQIDLHAAYGGVVPELASREHLRNIVPVVREAISRAGITLQDLDAVAVTEGPGLAGALLVGILYAKALAFGLGKPLIAINHLEGHIHAVLMQHPLLAAEPGSVMSPGSQSQPLLALVVSGGHTHLYLAHRQRESAAWSYENIGRTVDDAAGEAFDKVAKLLGLGYPGGPWIDALAAFGDPSAVRFAFHAIKSRHRRTRDGGCQDRVEDRENFDFSFSGIKTAVLRYTQTHQMTALIEARKTRLAQELSANPALKPADLRHLCDQQTLDLVASFQAAVVGNLVRQTFAAAERYGVCGILVSGGVSANGELRRRFRVEALKRNVPIAFPSISLATDNAAMIAAAAWPRLCDNDLAPESMSAAPQLKLG